MSEIKNFMLTIVVSSCVSLQAMETNPQHTTPHNDISVPVQQPLTDNTRDIAKATFHSTASLYSCNSFHKCPSSKNIAQHYPSQYDNSGFINTSLNKEQLESRCAKLVNLATDNEKAWRQKLSKTFCSIIKFEKKEKEKLARLRIKNRENN